MSVEDNKRKARGYLEKIETELLAENRRLSFLSTAGSQSTAELLQTQMDTILVNLGNAALDLVQIMNKIDSTIAAIDQTKTGVDGLHGEVEQLREEIQGLFETSENEGAQNAAGSIEEAGIHSNDALEKLTDSPDQLSEAKGATDHAAYALETTNARVYSAQTFLDAALDASITAAVGFDMTERILQSTANELEKYIRSA